MSQLLDPNSSAGPARTPRGRSRSPAGTKWKPVGKNDTSSGARVFVSKPDEATAEEHELVDVPILHGYSSVDGLGIGKPGTAHKSSSVGNEGEGYATATHVGWDGPTRRHRNTDVVAPRTDSYDSDDQQDAVSIVWSQNGTNVPRRNLTTFDVAALIFNKMVGSGIFTTTGAVLLLTGSKPISVVLWAVGGIYTLFCMFIYLEYGIALPFTGGELIYLNEIYGRPRILATIIFSAFFILLANSTGNSLVFSKHVLASALPDKTSTTDFDERLVRFIAIIILTTVCLLHYFSSKLGLFLNKAIALYKVLLLISVFIAGVIASRREGSGISDWYDKHGPNGNTKRADSLAASVLILYAYQGWENANYVGGEIKTPNSTLKRGALLAVSMVTILYVLVAAAYYMACDYATITGLGTDLGMAIRFGPRVFGGSGLAFKVSIALSAAGNLIATVYTSSKVKQAIACQGFIPFHEFFAQDQDTPKGGLVMHWFTSMLMISFTPNTSDGYSFVVGIFTYAHLIFAMFVAGGTFRLRQVMQKFVGGYKLQFLNYKPVLTLTIIFFIGMNLLAVIFGAKPHDEGKIPRFWWPVLFFIILAGSCLYWLVFWGLQQTLDHKTGTTVGQKIGLDVKVYEEDDENDEMSAEMSAEMKADMVKAMMDGTRRRTQYKYSGPFLVIGKAYRTTVDTLGEWFF